MVTLILFMPLTANAQGFWGGVVQGMIEGDKARDRRKALELEEQRLRMLEEQQRMQLEIQRRDMERQRQAQLEEERRRQAELQAQVEAQRRDEKAQIEAYRQGYTGTGFFVSKKGHIITNAHVLGDYQFVIAKDSTGRIYELDILAIDKKNDLALLQAAKKTEGLPIMPAQSVGKGLKVYSIGYPQPGIQGTESKITDGIISSMTGLRNDNDSYQISVPIQAGNSGGPLVTETGAVVGVIVATVNAKKFFAITGDIPQNVNFAIKPDILEIFMKANKITPLRAGKPKANPMGFADENTVMIAAKPERFDLPAILPPSGKSPTLITKPYQPINEPIATLPNLTPVKKEPMPGRYIDNGDGTITDLNTKLRWQRCSVGQKWDGNTCTGEPTEFNWTQAKNLSMDYAGIADWRLPTKDELKTIVECRPSMRYSILPDREHCDSGPSRPRINLIAFPATPESVYWAQEPGATQFDAWGVSFSFGAAFDNYARSHKVNVRLVSKTITAADVSKLEAR